MQIAIVGDPAGGYVQRLAAAATELGHTPHVIAFDQFDLGVSGGRPRTGSEVCDPEQLDAVVVRTMPPGTLEQVVWRMDLLAGLEAQGLAIVNSPKALECAVDKALTTQRLALARIPVPDTIVCESFERAMAAWSELGRDVLVKPLFGSEGRGIVRICEEEIAVRVLRTLTRMGSVLYLQRCLDTTGGDLRLLLLDGQLLGAIRRIPGAGEFRANLACAGTAIAYEPTDAERELAVRAAEVTQSVFAGVDLMYDDDGQPLVIEVNAVPGWKGLQQACRVNVAEVFLRWLESRVSAGARK